MPECDHEDCTDTATATLQWDTVSDLEKSYCDEHLQQARQEIPDWIQGVEIV